MIKERSSLIFVLRAMFLSFQITLRFASAPAAWAILESISGLGPSSVMIALNSFKLFATDLDGTADAVDVICHQLGILCTDLHGISC